MEKNIEETKEICDHLHRITGQIQAIERMITEKRTCVDVLQQIRAARSSLSSLERQLATSELIGCLPSDQAAGKVEKLVGTLLE